MANKKQQRDYGVTLFMPVTATDPVAAVEEFGKRTLQNGLANYAYAVRNEDDELIWVEGGETYTVAEFHAKLEAEDAEAEAETDVKPEASGGDS